MTGWLIYSKKDVEKNKRYINFYMEEGKQLGIHIKLVLLENLEFGIKNNTWFLYDKEEEKPDFAIVRTIYPLLSKQLELMDIKVYNNSKVAEICNDKGKTYQYLARLKIPMIETEFIKGNRLEEKIKDIKEPTIIKSVSGHGGNEVFLLDPSKYNEFQTATTKILKKLVHTDVVLQPFVRGKHQDLRVYVIGKDIVGAILRTASEGFKSNFSLGGKVCSYHLSSKERNVITKIVNEFDFGLVGIDFLIADDGSLIFNEIEDVVGARMLYQCSDINLVRLYLQYIFEQK